MKKSELGISGLVLVAGLMIGSGFLACGGGHGPECSGSEEISVTRSIGPAGGTLDLCDARITIPVNAYTSDVEVTITRRQVEGGVPFEFEQVSDVYSIQAGHANAKAVAVQIKHRAERHAGVVPAYLYDSSYWVMMEPCIVTTDMVEFHLDNSFDLNLTVLHDTEEFPDGLGGSGSQSVTVEGEDQARTFTLERPGFAIFTPNHGGIRRIDLMGFQMAGDKLLGKLRLGFTLDENGLVANSTSADLSVMVGKNFHSWSAVRGLTSARIEVELISLDVDRLAGTFQGQLENMDETISIHSGTFDVQVEKWRWPTSLYCLLE